MAPGQMCGFGTLIHMIVQLSRLHFGRAWPKHVAFVDYGVLQGMKLLECQGFPPVIFVFLLLGLFSREILIRLAVCNSLPFVGVVDIELRYKKSTAST